MPRRSGTYDAWQLGWDAVRGDCWICDGPYGGCVCKGGPCGVARRRKLLQAAYGPFEERADPVWNDDPHADWDDTGDDMDYGLACRNCGEYGVEDCKCPGGRAGVAERYRLQSAIKNVWENLNELLEELETSLDAPAAGDEDDADEDDYEDAEEGESEEDY